MNVQPKLSHDHEFPMPPTEGTLPQGGRRPPGGPRGFVTWPVEFEVEPWRP